LRYGLYGLVLRGTGGVDAVRRPKSAAEQGGSFARWHAGEVSPVSRPFPARPQSLDHCIS